MLLIVGSVDRELIAKHRRLREYTVEDYDFLVELLSPANQVLVTPNTLTETSNLLGQHADPERSLFFDKLRLLIQRNQEVVVASAEASRNNAFGQLGLTDAALLEAISAERQLLTVDLDLYLTALQRDARSAFNFNHLRQL